MKKFPSNNQNRNHTRNDRNDRTSFSSQRSSKKADVAPQREVRDMFTNWFERKRAKAGHVMSKNDVIKNVIKKLDIKQDKVLKKAMDELVSNKWIEVQEDGVTLVLTEKGALFINSI